MAVMIRLYATILRFPVILRRRIKPEVIDKCDLKDTRAHTNKECCFTALRRFCKPKQFRPVSQIH